MNDLSMPVRSTDRDEQQLLRAILTPDAHVSPLDRLSLRLGMWLLLRSARRARRLREFVERERFLDRQRLLREREHAEAWARVGRLPFL